MLKIDEHGISRGTVHVRVSLPLNDLMLLEKRLRVSPTDVIKSSLFTYERLLERCRACMMINHVGLRCPRPMEADPVQVPPPTTPPMVFRVVVSNQTTFFVPVVALTKEKRVISIRDVPDFPSPTKITGVLGGSMVAASASRLKRSSIRSETRKDPFQTLATTLSLLIDERGLDLLLLDTATLSSTYPIRAIFLSDFSLLLDRLKCHLPRRLWLALTFLRPTFLIHCISSCSKLRSLFRLLIADNDGRKHFTWVAIGLTVFRLLRDTSSNFRLLCLVV
ncbi:hypothetical protein ACLB2K_055924 [Fragaria x ananassa]